MWPASTPVTLSFRRSNAAFAVGETPAAAPLSVLLFTEPDGYAELLGFSTAPFFFLLLRTFFQSSRGLSEFPS